MCLTNRCLFHDLSDGMVLLFDLQKSGQILNILSLHLFFVFSLEHISKMYVWHSAPPVLSIFPCKTTFSHFRLHPTPGNNVFKAWYVSYLSYLQSTHLLNTVVTATPENYQGHTSLGNVDYGPNKGMNVLSSIACRTFFCSVSLQLCDIVWHSCGSVCYRHTVEN